MNPIVRIAIRLIPMRKIIKHIPPVYKAIRWTQKRFPQVSKKIMAASASSGTAASVGLYGLVAAAGVTSTGVAISSLAGAAKITATLAAIGGSMIGGIAVLSSVAGVGGAAAVLAILEAQKLIKRKKAKNLWNVLKLLKWNRKAKRPAKRPALPNALRKLLPEKGRKKA